MPFSRDTTAYGVTPSPTIRSRASSSNC